jgi:CheY-like chemotaxis protein
MQSQAREPLNVLVVDDNQDVANSLTQLIRVLGHSAHPVYDGEAAVEAAAVQHPDVVFLDIGMPRVDGYDVARQLAAEASAPDFRLVAVTGHSDGDHKRAAADAGFTDYLVKPFVADDVIRILNGARLSPPSPTSR